MLPLRFRGGGGPHGSLRITFCSLFWQQIPLQDLILLIPYPLSQLVPLGGIGIFRYEEAPPLFPSKKKKLFGKSIRACSDMGYVHVNMDNSSSLGSDKFQTALGFNPVLEWIDISGVKGERRRKWTQTAYKWAVRCYLTWSNAYRSCWVKIGV